jgi:putative hydrolase of the HAD superfamily
MDQLQKLIQLGLEYVFHAVTISEETGSEKLTTDTLSRTLERLGNVKPERAVFVGSDLANEIAPANAAKMITVRIKTGTHDTVSLRVPDERPAFEIVKPADVLGILQRNS